MVSRRELKLWHDNIVWVIHHLSISSVRIHGTLQKIICISITKCQLESDISISYWRKFVSRNLLESCGCRVMMSASRSISRQWYWPSRVTYGSLLSSSKYALVRTYKKERISELWPKVYAIKMCTNYGQSTELHTSVNELYKIWHLSAISNFSL